jgi:hypothetical protein
MSERNSFWGRFKNIVEAGSVGKYHHGLYLDGNSHQSSFLGGLLTLLAFVALITYASLLFASIASRSDYILSQSEAPVNETLIDELGVSEFMDSAFIIDEVNLDLFKVAGFTNCS